VHLSTLLEMAADGLGERRAVGPRQMGLTYAGLREQARRAAAWIATRDVQRAGLADVNSEAVPTLLYGSCLADVPFVPVNYRLADDQLREILARTAPSVVVVDPAVIDRVGDIDGVLLVPRATFLSEIAAIDPGTAPVPAGSPNNIAVLLFTSGTTGAPKAAVLRHRHLASYVISTVEFMGADEDEVALVSVPPYHVAGTSAVLTSIYAGRRIVYLPTFTPEAWIAAARDEEITQAMVVPTMLGRMLDLLERSGEKLPHLRHLSYGGGRMARPVIERALALLPHVDFVNAYGLTETSSTIAVLGPADHREAVTSDDPARRRRLGSVGRPLPDLAVEIRAADGTVLGAGESGEIWVRGDQVAGEYVGSAGVLHDGWLPTKDGGWLDDDGYLYLAGRLDDVIVRGAENMSPGEIEDVLVAHPAVAHAGVVGVPDAEWGEMVVAAVVLADDARATEEELRAWVRQHLRSSKTPEHIDVRSELPYNETGKLLRRVLKAELSKSFGASRA
jgi:acyl-CoA synthetase (AMP-forming)/AMP-acid ligase II